VRTVRRWATLGDRTAGAPHGTDHVCGAGEALPRTVAHFANPWLTFHLDRVPGVVHAGTEGSVAERAGARMLEREGATLTGSGLSSPGFLVSLDLPHVLDLPHMLGVPHVLGLSSSVRRGSR
jgi:hypothetical protein